MKKKNQNGFTLIELLVVVAIIGILAAVGVVAYSGYTSSAKKNAAGSNHATVLKYISAEVQKCNIGEDKVMKNPAGAEQLTCSNRGTAKTVTKAAVNALSEFKNPYRSGAAVVDAAAMTACSTTTEGQTTIVDDGSTFTITTCKSKETADLMTSKGTIE